MPFICWLTFTFFNNLSKLGAEFITPVSDGFVSDENPTISQPFSDISITIVKSMVAPNTVANNFSWVTMAFRFDR